jgi:hypothetical protein
MSAVAKVLAVSYRNALTHVSSLEQIVRKQTGLGTGVRLDADWDQENVAISLIGPSCEPTRRNRGGLTHVAPLIRITKGVWAWLGLYEEWRFNRQVAGSRTYAFRSLSMTIHFGSKFDMLKLKCFALNGLASLCGRVLTPHFKPKMLGIRIGNSMP